MARGSAQDESFDSLHVAAFSLAVKRPGQVALAWLLVCCFELRQVRCAFVRDLCVAGPVEKGG